MIVIDETNWQQLLGPTHDEQLHDGSIVPVRVEGGQKRYLSRIPTQSGRHIMSALPRFRDSFPTIPRSDWDAMIDEKDALKTWVDDYQWFAPHDQDGLPTCFPAGTLIRMADGSQRRIEDVKTTDLVLTAEGNTRRVIGTMVKRANLLVKIRAWGHSHLQCTPEHPILTKRGYVAAGDLRADDYVCFPRYSPKQIGWIATEQHIENRHNVKKTTRGTRTVGLPGRKQVAITTHVVPDVIHLTPEFGRVIGFFLAEGSTGKGTVNWTFNIKERDTFATELVQCIKASVGADATIRERPNNTCQVELYGVAWAKMFENLCSVGAGNKRLHPALCGGSKEFLSCVLSAWMDGDRHRGNSAVSISRELALNMFDIANACGHMPVLTTHNRAKIDANGVVHRHSWHMGWGDKSQPNHGTHQTDTHLWRRVRSVETIPFDGDVFNLEVEGDSSYVAEGIGVHNCWANGPAHAGTTRRVMDGLPLVYLSACSAAQPISGGHSGGDEADAGDYFQKHGAASVDVWPNNSTQSLSSDPKVVESRTHHKFYQVYSLNGFDEFATAMLLSFPMAVAFNWWQHVISGGRLLKGYKACYRNNWGDWGDKNRLGQPGYITMVEGHGTPDSGFCIGPLTMSNT